MGGIIQNYRAIGSAFVLLCHLLFSSCEDIALRYQSVELTIKDPEWSYPGDALGKISAPSTVANGRFGSVAIFGNYAIMGATGVDEAYIYYRSGSSWSLIKPLLGSGGENFGKSVALGSQYAVVGAPAFSGNTGRVYIYSAKLGWAQDGSPLTVGSGDYFGQSVAVWGNRLIVGADSADGAATGDGAAYVYERSGSWNLKPKLRAQNGESNDKFGYSVSIDDDRALVAARRDDVGANVDEGSVYVFIRSGDGNYWGSSASGYENVQLNAAGGQADMYFGNSVSLHGDYALIGAPKLGGNEGAAYLFQASGAQWSQVGNFAAGDPGDWFGVAVDIYDEVAVVGAYTDGTMGVNSGSIYFYELKFGKWTQMAKFVTPGDADDFFGASVSLTDQYALAGAPGVSVGALDWVGAAYAYNRD